MIVGFTTSQRRFGVRELSENGSASRVETRVRPYILSKANWCLFSFRAASRKPKTKHFLTTVLNIADFVGPLSNIILLSFHFLAVYNKNFPTIIDIMQVRRDVSRNFL